MIYFAGVNQKLVWLRSFSAAMSCSSLELLTVPDEPPVVPSVVPTVDGSLLYTMLSGTTPLREISTRLGVRKLWVDRRMALPSLL